MAARLWIDVEDLFEYARTMSRPSGIQRLAFEVYATLQERHGATGLIQFVRHDPSRNSLRVVGWPEVAALFDRLTAPAQTQVQARMATLIQSGPIRPHPPRRQMVRRLVYRLPPALRVHVTDVLLTQARAFVAWAGLTDAVFRGVVRIPHRIRRRRAAAAAMVTALPQPPDAVAAVPQAFDAAYADVVAPGDVLLVLGSPWSHPDYATFVQAQRERHGIRFALLVYDLIPLRRPEWCDRGLVRLFREWFTTVFPLCDAVFAISRATAADVEAYARQRGITLPGAVVPIPIGTGFGPTLAHDPASRSERLPAVGEYALIVSTIEARKNHLLLFRVWRRLLEELPREQVPTLVFAGRIGWLVDDLMRQIANTDNLDGKLVIIENPSDPDLAALYQGCLFTLFPSFFEGWGLPVTESLAFGKPCLISNRTSLPEAGCGLARSFDPDNLNDAYAAIHAVVADRAGLAMWEAQVRRDFRPVPWSATVDALLAGLRHPLAEAVERV